MNEKLRQFRTTFMKNTTPNFDQNLMKLPTKIKTPKLLEWDSAQKSWVDANLANLAKISIT